MSVAVLLVTHGKLSQTLLDTVTEVLGNLPLRTEVLEVRRVNDTQPLIVQGEQLITELDEGQGVLVLTDAFGSTPSNIANHIAGCVNSRVVAGLNLPMLFKIYNYPQLSLDDLATAAVEGGQRGILACEPHPV